MKAQVGDRLAVSGRHVGQPTREGVVMEVLSGPESHYRVRWEHGEESIFFPQSDTQVAISPGGPRPMERAMPMMATATVADPTAQPGMTTIDLRPAPTEGYSHHGFEMWLAEDDTHTEARVTVQLREVEMTGFGIARRNPHDPQVPMVGEELAMARALSDLADQLFQLATFQIERREGRRVDIDL